MRPFLPLLLCATAWLAGCDALGLESASAAAARREAEGKAVGGACRHAGRAIEDCYALNKKADKGAVFAGWREMNDYMRENKIEAVAPSLPNPADVSAKVAGGEGDHGDEHEEKPGKADKHDKAAKADKPAKASGADKGGKHS